MVINNELMKKNQIWFDLECKEEYTVNKILKTERIKNIESFEDCRYECQHNVKCNIFNFKV